MNKIPKYFFRWPAIIQAMTLPPIFFLVFTIVYNPFGIDRLLDMGRGLFTLNVTLLFVILLVVDSLTRLVFHLFEKARKFTWFMYITWCIGEILVGVLFASMYVSLISLGEYPYFDALFRICLPKMFLIMVFPYIILSLGFTIAGSAESDDAREAGDDSLIRFYDVYHKPKLVIAVKAILYIKADENYMSIWYSDNGRPVKYSLRAPMNSIEESCTHHGLVRCQRSYFINPERVTILRKQQGWIYADLDMEGVPSIPVSKRYYDKLANLL